MADLKERAISLLVSAYVADMQSDSPTLNVLYTIPTGKRCIIDQVVIRDPSASLAGMNDVDFGWGATALGWLNNETGIGDMTATTDFMVLRADSDEYTIGDGDDSTVANRSFGMYVVSGSTGAASAYVDVFGYLLDS